MAADFARQSCLVLTLALTLPAQRDEATLPQKPGKVTIAYGAVNVGAHGLHELPVGNTWRMGHGDPSTLLSELPLLAGDKVLAPGGYGVNIYRAGESDLRLNVGGGGGRGGGRRGGGGGGPSSGIQFRGELTEPKKKTKKLELTWLRSLPKKKGDGDAKATDASAPKSKGLKTCCLRVNFGPNRLEIPVTVVGANSHKVRGFTALGFTWPLKLFKARLASSETPLVSLIPKKIKRGEAPGFNVMVGETVVVLKPMAKPPEGFRRGRGGRGGRGGDRPQDRDPQAEPQEMEGSVKWEAAQEQVDHVVIKAVKLIKKQLSFEIHMDDRIGKVRVDLPTPAKSKNKK